MINRVGFYIGERVTYAKRIVIFIYLVGLLFGCAARKNTAKYGVLISKLHFWDTLAQDYIDAPGYWVDQRIWYRDSAVIQETVSIFIVDSLGVERRSTAVGHYTFMNLRTREFYRYLNFSDTAMVIKQFIGPDSMAVDGPWNFYTIHGLFHVNKDEKLSDTLIRKTNYKRVPIYVLPNPADTVAKEYGVIYLRCDKKNGLVQYHKELGDSLGCPIVRTERTPKSISGQIDYIADKFSPEERKIFDTWEKYAKQNPVKRE